MVDPKDLSADTSQLERWGEAMSKAPERLATESRKALKRTALNVQKRLEGRFIGAYSHAQPSHPDHLQTRSGEGKRSFRLVSGGNSLATMSEAVVTTSPYVPVHQTGATIRPKTAKMLTIPAEAALNPSGIPLFTAGEAFTRLNAFFWRYDENKPPAIATRDGGELEVLFWGASQVVIPPRLGADKIASDPKVKDLLLSELGKGATRALRFP